MRMFAGLCLLLAVLLVGSVAQTKHQVQGPFPAKAGETCVICYGVLDSTGLAYLVDGRRFTVDASEAGEFLEDPEAHIQLFEAHQASERRKSLLVPGAAVVLAAGTLLVVWLRRRRR